MDNIFKYGSITAIPLYNCSAHTPEEWSERNGVRRPIVGSLDLAYGILLDIIYIPIIIVMFEKSHFKFSCFKIMILLGIVDMMALGVSSIVTGFLAIQGAVFCTYPRLIYISGMIGLGLWCSSCMLALILVTNRIIDLTKPTFLKLIFGGNRTFLVLTLPIFYAFGFMIFTTPVTFTSRYMSWFFDPMIFKNMSHKYSNFPQALNNFIVVAATCMLYSVLCSVLGKKFKSYTTGCSKKQKLSAQIFFQSSLICAANQISSLVYVFMNFIEVPEWVIWLGHLSWQFGHGAPVLIYLTLNRTIRTSLFKLICSKVFKEFGRRQIFLFFIEDFTVDNLDPHNTYKPKLEPFEQIEFMNMEYLKKKFQIINRPGPEFERNVTK